MKATRPMVQQSSYTEALRQSVMAVLGAPPDPAPLLPEVLDSFAGPGYRGEHIKFQVSPNDWSYGYLLIPEGLSAPAPAVYYHHRHDYAAGKSEVISRNGSTHDTVGAELARRGYVVFAPDALGFGERRSPESDGPAFDLAYNYHQLALRLLRGETLLRKVISDVSRGLDYLETRAEIDSRFIGFIGFDYGSCMAIWAAALDERIRAVVAHGGVTNYREHVRRGEWLQAEFVVPRLMQVADLHHILMLIAPRPVLLSVVEGAPQSADTLEIYRRARPTYEQHGVANRLALYRYAPDEAPEQVMRHHAYTWLDSWLHPF